MHRLAVGVGREREDRLARERRGGIVGAQGLLHRRDVRQLVGLVLDLPEEIHVLQDATELGGEPLLLLRRETQLRQPGDVPDTCADTTALAQAVGYRPATPVAVGVGRFAEWYLERYGSAGSAPPA